jgi:hypothetical protein
MRWPHLHVAVIVTTMRDSELKRLVERVVHLEPVVAELCKRVLFTQTDRAVLHRSEDRRRHRLVVHLVRRAAVQPLRKQDSRLDRHRRQLEDRT